MRLYSLIFKPNMAIASSSVLEEDLANLDIYNLKSNQLKDNLDQNDKDINELNDLKSSIESDYNSENIELLTSLVESGKETIDRLSESVYQKAKEIMR